MRLLECQRCTRIWLYGGDERRGAANCPSCRTSVSFANTVEIDWGITFEVAFEGMAPPDSYFIYLHVWNYEPFLVVCATNEKGKLKSGFRVHAEKAGITESILKKEFSRHNPIPFEGKYVVSDRLKQLIISKIKT